MYLYKSIHFNLSCMDYVIEWRLFSLFWLFHYFSLFVFLCRSHAETAIPTWSPSYYSRIPVGLVTIWPIKLEWRRGFLDNSAWVYVVIIQCPDIIIHQTIKLVESGCSAVFCRLGGTSIPSPCVQGPVEFLCRIPLAKTGLET